jgi:beta-lactam-binding protein with PASTA domain
VEVVVKSSEPEEVKVPGVENATEQVARERLADAGLETEAPDVARVPDLVGLSYPEAENSLEESGFLLGGVEEARSETVPAGMIIKQDSPPGTTLEPNSYVYLTTSVGPPEESYAAARGTSGSVSGSQHEPSSDASDVVAAVSADVDSLLRRYHPKEGFTSAADTQYGN